MTAAPVQDVVAAPSALSRRAALVSYMREHPLAMAAATCLSLIALMAICAPLISGDPTTIDPGNRLKPMSSANWFGTDQLGRDIWSRVVHGGRISLIVALAVSTLAVGIGTFLGLMVGYFRMVDAVVMRILDGFMAIPGILLAIALVSLSGASVTTVVVAITIPEIPRVVRLVRSIVLQASSEPYIEAAISVGTSPMRILFRHIMPNCLPPLIVQASYIAAAAMLLEAVLSFLGTGTPPEIPSWGNIMSEGRIAFSIAPWIVMVPGVALAVTIFAMNMLGDELRDLADPRLKLR